MGNANELAQNVGAKKETMTRLTPDLYAYLTTTYQQFRTNEKVRTVATVSQQLTPAKRGRVKLASGNRTYHATEHGEIRSLRGEP